VPPLLHKLLTGIAGVGVLATAACAGRSGPQPAPPLATLEPYNGEWVLDAANRSTAGLQFASTDGHGISSETMEKIGGILMMRAEQLALEVNDTVFRLSGDEPAFSLSLPMDGTPVEVQAEDGDGASSMTLSWSEGMPVVRQTLPGIGWVSDRYEVTADGGLVITRRASVRNVRGAEVEGSRPVELVYVRSSAVSPTIGPARGVSTVADS